MTSMNTPQPDDSLREITTKTGRFILYDSTDARKRISSSKTIPIQP